MTKTDKIATDDLIDFSQKSSDSTYTSRAIKYSDFENVVKTTIDSDHITTYGLREGDRIDGDPIKLSVQKKRIDDILSSDTTTYGTYTFKKIPKITEAYLLTQEDTAVPTVGYTKTLITDSGTFIGTGNTLIHRVEGGNAPNNEITNTNWFTKDDDQFLHFRFDDGGYDSSEYIKNTDGDTLANADLCQRSGNLVCYGWLADKGNVAPQNAWVALYGYVQGQWVILQLQPWIIGQKSQSLQYVGFNVPVKAGLYLKIMTGFPVDGTNSGFQSGRTLTFSTGEPNSFVGYILYNP